MDHPSKGHPNTDASISLTMRYTYLTDAVMIDATSIHADREAVDGVPSAFMIEDITPIEAIKPPPAKKLRAASISEAQVQHARREAVPPKRSTSSTPAPTISDAVVQHARREAIPPKLPPSSMPAPTISDAVVQHAEREAVPPKAEARRAWPCGSTKVVAKDEPKRRFLKRKLAESEAPDGKPLSDEQLCEAQELGLVPPAHTVATMTAILEAALGGGQPLSRAMVREATALGLMPADRYETLCGSLTAAQRAELRPLGSQSAASLAWLSAVHPLQSTSVAPGSPSIVERARRVRWRPWDVVQTTLHFASRGAADQVGLRPLQAPSIAGSFLVLSRPPSS